MVCPLRWPAPSVLCGDGVGKPAIGGGVAQTQRDVRARIGKSERDGTANAAGGSGDKRYLTAQIESRNLVYVCWPSKGLPRQARQPNISASLARITAPSTVTPVQKATPAMA